MKRGWALALLLVGCGDDPVFDRKAMLESLSREVLVPAHVDLAERANALDAAARDACAEGASPASLETLQQRWREAHAAMRHTDAFAFGPLVDEPLRLGPKLDFWPVRESTIDEILAGDAAIDAAYLASRGAAARGLPAIEYLVFEGELDARRCAYVIAATADVAATSAMLRDAWQGGYAASLSAEGEAYPTLHDGVSELFSRSVFAVENAIAVRIQRPRGAMNGGAAELTLLESRYAERSAEDIADSIRGVEDVYRGDVDRPGEGTGFRDYVMSRKPELDPQVQAAFADVYASLDALEMPLGDAITTAPDRVDAIEAALKALHRVLGIDVANALAVTVTFNDTDGD